MWINEAWSHLNCKRYTVKDHLKRYKMPTIVILMKRDELRLARHSPWEAASQAGQELSKALEGKCNKNETGNQAGSAWRSLKLLTCRGPNLISQPDKTGSWPHLTGAQDFLPEVNSFTFSLQELSSKVHAKSHLLHEAGGGQVMWEPRKLNIYKKK